MSARTSRRSSSHSLRDSGISISEKKSKKNSDSSSEEDVESERSISKVDTDSDSSLLCIDNATEDRKKKKCLVCGKRFVGMTDLRRHHLIHTNEKPFECKICSKAYRQKVNLNKHMQTSHGNCEFTCMFCRRTFKLKQRLLLHLPVHTGDKPYSCPRCPETFATGQQLQDHLDVHDAEKNKRCLICSTKFSTAKNLRMHMKRHEQGKSHACKFCKKIFPTDRLMRVHLNTAHTHKMEFDCQLCEKTIKEDVSTHMQMHAKTKPYKCDECDSEFTHKSQYSIHKRTHTGERPYQCRVCWRNFGHANVLFLHTRKHTGEKPFKCVLCNLPHVAFSQLSHLKTHMKSIHKKTNAYACEGCTECFKSKMHLESHMVTCEKLLLDKFKPVKVETIEKDARLLSRLRYLIAVLINKISTPAKLKTLGFEKRLIDNVLVASLKVANRKCFENEKMNELDRMKLNIQEFLKWIVPAEIMNGFKMECPSIESILDKIVTMYLKKVT